MWDIYWSNDNEIYMNKMNTISMILLWIYQHIFHPFQFFKVTLSRN